ncbi:ribonucleotide-diphosphate reductase subunit beta [Halorientalis marina]|uniref:ribonucleotide-diphosphate reductase subunit beta n=1 Tax=Halorientalis marina TaxID=2931976 RepID=UPI001FF3A2E8|nr:ribonucleotide-diphosphate reductase subunit beta [Halorientalis marina]
MSGTVNYGNRIDSDDKIYELFQKGVELGGWNAEKLIEQVPVEKDRETWANMDDDESEQFARLICVFMDGEQEVAQDASRLIQMAGSPYLDNNSVKEMFYANLAFEEAKHTQFFTWYVENVIPDDVVSSTGEGRQNGVERVPLTAGSGGYKRLFDRQRQLLSAATEMGADPVDIARATTNYNLGVEGIIARGGYFIRNRMMQNAELPSLSKGFQLISTDEGRHITAGIEIVKELLEKERAGKPEYQGVDAAVWDQVKTDLPDIYDLAVYICTDPGHPDNTDPLDANIDEVLSRFSNLYHDVFVESLGLESFDPGEFARFAGEQAELCKSKVDEGVFDRNIEQARELHERRAERLQGSTDVTAADDD